MAANYVAFAGWIALIAGLAAYGVDLVPTFVVGLVAAAVVTWLVSPSRGWWGPGPAQVMADRSALRRYRKRTLTVFVLAIFLVPPLVWLTLGQLGLLPP